MRKQFVSLLNGIIAFEASKCPINPEMHYMYMSLNASGMCFPCDFFAKVYINKIGQFITYLSAIIGR